MLGRGSAPASARPRLPFPPAKRTGSCGSHGRPGGEESQTPGLTPRGGGRTPLAGGRRGRRHNPAPCPPSCRPAGPRSSPDWRRPPTRSACWVRAGYRPLHNDEGVTLRVASNDSLRGVLDLAVNYRHGPPLHYVLVHMSLLWREDVLGLRFPSALLGITAVLLAYGYGRELPGRAGGASSASWSRCRRRSSPRPVRSRLHRCSPPLPQPVAAAGADPHPAGTLDPPYAVVATLLAASHPFGLFALFSELILLVLLGSCPRCGTASGATAGRWRWSVGPRWRWARPRFWPPPRLRAAARRSTTWARAAAVVRPTFVSVWGDLAKA